MTLEEFKDFVKTGKPLDTEEIHRFMDRMSGEARRITFHLNSTYRTPEEVRSILSGLFGKEVPSTFRVFPPFYTTAHSSTTARRIPRSMHPTSTTKARAMCCTFCVPSASVPLSTAQRRSASTSAGSPNAPPKA